MFHNPHMGTAGTVLIYLYAHIGVIGVSMWLDGGSPILGYVCIAIYWWHRWDKRARDDVRHKADAAAFQIKLDAMMAAKLAANPKPARKPRTAKQNAAWRRILRKRRGW